MKFIIFLGIVLGVLYFFRLTKRTNTVTKRPPPAKTIQMVQCAYCGTHIPENEAITRQGQTWCDEKHAQLGTRA